MPNLPAKGGPSHLLRRHPPITWLLAGCLTLAASSAAATPHRLECRAGNHRGDLVVTPGRHGIDETWRARALEQGVRATEARLVEMASGRP